MGHILNGFMIPVLNEPHHDKTCMNRSDTDKAVQPKTTARGLKFLIQEVEELYCLHIVKTKAPIICGLIQVALIFPIQRVQFLIPSTS